MTDAFIVRRGGSGGGSVGLNFEVKAYATEADLPDTASENEIAVFTDVELTGWIFSPIKPENPAPGVVWVFTGSSSTVAFNALKTNGIQIYPISAKQYVGSAWVDKTAKSFQYGEWVDWWIDGTLFINGVYDKDVGEWGAVNYSVSTGYTNVPADVRIEGDSLVATMTSTAIRCSTVVAPLAVVDLTDYDMIQLEFDSVEVNNNGMVALVVLDANGYEVVTGDVAIYDADKTFTPAVSADVSGRSGNHRVGFKMWGWDASTRITAKMTLARLTSGR